MLVLKENLDLSELSQPSDGNKMLSAEYREHIVGIPYTGFTIVPASLFNADKVADFARFLDVKRDEKVFSQPLDADRSGRAVPDRQHPGTDGLHAGRRDRYRSGAALVSPRGPPAAPPRQAEVGAGQGGGGGRRRGVARHGAGEVLATVPRVTVGRDGDAVGHPV